MDTNLAKYILANSSINFNTDNPVSLQNPNHPGILSRIVDVLSRPNYAIANMFHAAAEQKNPISALFRGLEGKDKTTFSTVLKEDLGVKNPVVSGLGGAALDIALDPTSYIGTGAIKGGLTKVGGKLGITNKFAKVAAELPPKPVQELITEPITKENVVSNVANYFKQSKRSTPEANELVKQAAGVAPSAVPKPKPEVNLSPVEQDIGTELATKFKSTSKSKINLKAPDTVNPTEQLGIFSKIQKEIEALYPKNPAKQFEKSYQMLQHVENELAKSGKSLRYWDGSDFKLSDMFSELVTGKGIKFTRETLPILGRELRKVNVRFKDPDITQAIHNVRVRSALMDSDKVGEAINSVLKEKALLGTLPASDAHLNQLFKAMPALAQRHAAQIQASAAGVQAAKDLTRATLREAQTAPERALTSTSGLTRAALGSGEIKSAPAINQPLTNALIKELDIPKGKFKLPLNGDGGVVDTILGRLFSWYGQKDLRPLTEQQLLSAVNTAWLRTLSIKQIADKYPREAQLQAMRFAQGLDPVATDLGRTFRTAIENLFKGSGLSDQAWAAQTVAERAGLLMDRLNYHLARVKLPYKFTNKKIKNPITGAEQDYSKGTDWLKSWQSWDVKEPLKFFYGIQSAVEQAAHEKALFDDLAERFGSTIAGGGYHTKINHPYLHGYFFTDDIARQIPYVVRDLNEFFTSGANSKFLQTFDKIIRTWKYTVTLPNPSHHIHNLLGDTYLSWMDGVNGVKPYEYAARVLRSQKSQYEGINDIENLVAVGALDKAFGKTPDAKEVLFRNASGVPFTAEQIYIAANQHGTLPRAKILEDIMGADSTTPVGNKLKVKLEHLSETREHFARLAHFIDVVRKSKGNNIKDIFEKAAYRVRKWHPDYLTLTPFEKKFMRRIMPFYSWTRRAIPLVIESAVMNPGKTLVYPKLMQGFQDMEGIDAGRANPFPADQLFPQWIRDRGIGPVFKDPRWGARGDYGYTIVNPSNPLYDIFGQFSSPVTGFGQMLSPAIKIPVELLSDKQLFSGAPINKQNFSEYLGNQLPYFPLLQSMTGITPTGGLTGRAQKEGIVNTERLVNWLTSLGIRGTGPYIKEAQFEKGGMG